MEIVYTVPDAKELVMADGPLIAIVLTTKCLLGEMDLTRPIQTDETFKVIHEG